MKVFNRIVKLLCILLGVFLYAQGAPVTLDVEKTIATTNEDLITVMVKVENTTSQVYHLQLISKGDNGIRVLNRSVNINLQAREKIFVPVKIFIEKSQPAGSSEVVFALLDGNNNSVARSLTELTIATKRSLRIIANEPQQLIERIGDSLRISTQVYNAGNRAEEVEIITTFPQGYNSDLTQKKTIVLEPFSDREVVFARIIDKDLLKLEIFTVSIAARNENRDYFGNVTVMVQNALGNRRYIDPLNLSQYLQRSSPNRIALSTSNPFSQFSASHNLDLHTEVNIGNTKAGINVNGTYWPQREDEIMLQNTRVNLENGPFGLQIGNINSTDLEISLMGRGAEFSYNPVNDAGFRFSAGAVDKSYNLLDPLTKPSQGYSAFARSHFTFDEKKTLSSEVVLDTDPIQKGFIFKNSYEFNNKDTYYSVDLGYGFARGAVDAEAAESSMAVGFNYRKNWKKYVFNSNNYYSSGYYPGIKRGSTVFEQRLSRNFEKLSVYAGYSLNIFEPKNIDPLYPYNTSSMRSRIEAGSSFPVVKGLSMSLSSQISGENSEIFLGSSFQQTMVDFRLATLRTAINYNTPDNRDRISLLYSQGVSYYGGLTKPRYIQQVQANWYRGDFMLSASYQEGAFMLYEGNVNGSLNADTQKISGFATYRLALLNKKLNMNFSALGNYDRRTGNTLSFSSSFDYKMFRATRVFGNVNYNTFSRDDFSTANTYYQLGVSQELPTIGDETVKYKNGVIRIFAFFDLDNDNAYNPSVDKPAPHVKVKINKTIFVADDEGNIRYRKVPFGEYTIKSLDTKWYADDQIVQLAQKEVFLTIPLEKTSVVRGFIEYQLTSKTQYEVQEIMAGIPVIFKNTFGKTFTFYTNATGEYNAYLPLGTYTVSVETTVLQKNVYIDDNLQTASAVEGTTNTLENFLLKVKEKKVEVKKFGLPN
ncbi:MAG: hypothetical protein K0M63_06335 [Weeksellaceae bacterium]|nr:hypothetical protein [Weeksellaceae bacterium]